MNFSPNTLKIVLALITGLVIGGMGGHIFTRGGATGALKSVEPALTKSTTETTNHNQNDIKIKKGSNINLTDGSEQTATTIVNDTCYTVSALKEMSRREVLKLRR